MRGRLLAAGVVVLGTASPASAAPSLEAARVKLPRDAVGVLEQHLAGAPPVARRLTRLVAPHLTFRIARDAVDRAHGVPLPDGGRRYVITLRPTSWQATRRGRFVFLHEIGHIVDWAFVGPSLRDKFRAAFAESPRHRACFEWRGGCVPEHEVFAEQFAFWAGADRRLRSGYATPPLLSRAAFGRLMEEAGWTEDSPLRVTR